MRARYSAEKTRHETYTVMLSHDRETGVVVAEKWYRDGAPQFERQVIRDRVTGEITREKFRAGALKATRQYGPQKPPVKRKSGPERKAKIA